ncbi:chorismate synthase [uncultured Oscillibacter sp.]|uniref:chorismate synthase n=1 Tax=uncultured Oscillibacter sp. TaxID=876091 RepID=UPI0026249BB4|nr:chorismate synthase [uncultured Oscillibacter sp.]
MSSEFGNIIRVSVFGQSHGKAIGVVVDGLPAGEAIDLEELQRFLDRRRPGTGPLSTARKETDVPEFLSGLEGGKTCGAPLCAVIKNADQHSKDYGELADKPRPGHADFTAWAKWGGHADMRGGGHFSGRLTAPLCVAGGIAKQILARRGIFVGAHLASVAGICDRPFPLYPTAALFSEIAAKPFPVLDGEAGERMRAAILDAKNDLDSVGGVIECAATGLPPGLGEPMFGGVENRLAAALFGIPAVKGVEFGEGFRAAELRGSENNDPFTLEDGEIRAETNRAGGILGGITTGMPLVLRAAVKPTPSIGRPQKTVRLSAMEAAELAIHGRHDPCVAHRAVPVMEAVTAAVLLDMLLEGNHGTF